MDDQHARADKASRKAARKAAAAAAVAAAATQGEPSASADHNNNNNSNSSSGGGDHSYRDRARPDGADAQQDMPPRKKSRKEHRAAEENQNSHLHAPVVYDHSHLPIPQLHPSLAGLVPQQQQQHSNSAGHLPQEQYHHQAHRNSQAPPAHYQQAAHVVGSGSGHRDIPVDPVLLGLLPTPPAHFSTSSVRSGGGAGGAGGADGRGDPATTSGPNHHQEAAEATAAAAAAVAELARAGNGGGGDGDGSGENAATAAGKSGGKKRKDKGKEKAKLDNIEVGPAAATAAAAAATGADEKEVTPAAAASASAGAPSSATRPERFEPLQDLYGQVQRILGPDHLQKRTGHGHARASAGGTIGAEGVEKAKGGFYEQLRSKWMSTKDLKQLAEQYGATYKQGKFSLAEDTALREAMEQFRLSRGLTAADLRRLLVMKRDVRKPLAHGQSQNEIWEYLAQALGDRPLLSIYNHVKLLVAGDPIEAAAAAAAGSASASALGTPQPEAAGAANGNESAAAAGTAGPNTDAQAVASGSGNGTGTGLGAAAGGGGAPTSKGSGTPKPNFTTVPGPTLEGVLGDANRKGRWTPDEDQSLARLLKELGTSWNEIGRQLGRSGTACRDRWTKQLNNGLALGMLPNGDSVPVQKAKEGKWTDAEVEQLRALHAEYGSQWKLISTKMGGTRTSTQCRTKWTDYIARREAAGFGKAETDQGSPAAAEPGGRKESAGAREDWRWHASDGSRLIHTIAALNVSDPTEIDWKAIDDPRLALHGAKNLRDRFRHLVKNAKLEVQREVGSIAEVPFKDALAHLLIQHPTPDYDPSQAVSDAEKAQQRARRRAERKAAKKAEREQRAGAAQAAALHVANLGPGLDGGSAAAAAAAAAAFMQQQQQHAPIVHPPARAMGGPDHLIGRTSHLSQAYIEDSDGSDDGRGDIRVDVMGRRV